MGVTQGALDSVRGHVMQEFLSRAALGHQETQYLESGAGTKEFLIVEQARTYRKAICWAAGELADLLTQAALSKTNGRDIPETVRAAVCEEALAFAEVLATEQVWSAWLRNCRLPEVRDQQSVEWEGCDKQAFFKRVSHHRAEWVSEADRRVNLRLELAPPEVRQAQKPRRVRTGPEASRRLRYLIATVARQNPTYSQRQICGRIDDICLRTKQEIPVLASWKKAGVTSLTQAFDSPTLQGRVKKFISTALSNAGL